MKNNQKNLFGIIGLGRFGFALAESLSEAGAEIIALDRDENKVKAASAFTDNAFTVYNISRDTLSECGIQNCDTVVVCIGEAMDTSILTTLNVKELGVKRVISKASSTDQGAVLERLGAEVVYPDRDVALRLSKRLTSSRIMEHIALSEDVDISELSIGSRCGGTTVGGMNPRKKYGLNIIAVKHGDEITTEISADTPLEAGDIIVVCGKRQSILNFEAEAER